MEGIAIGLSNNSKEILKRLKKTEFVKEIYIAGSAEDDERENELIQLQKPREILLKKWKKVELYNVINLSIIIELKRSNFPKVLDTICDFYQNEENYEMCAKIQKLKKKI